MSFSCYSHHTADVSFHCEVVVPEPVAGLGLGIASSQQTVVLDAAALADQSLSYRPELVDELVVEIRREIDPLLEHEP